MYKYRYIFVVLFFNTILFANIKNEQPAETISQENTSLEVKIEKTFEEKSQISVKEQLSDKKLELFFTNKKVLNNYYKNFNFNFFWVNEKGIKEIALSLLETIKTDPVLKPYSNEAFKLDKIVNNLNSLERTPEKYFESMAKIDFMLTEVYDRYMKYLSKGIINWSKFQKHLKELDKNEEIIADWEKVNVNKNNSKLLIAAINQNDLNIAFNEVNFTFPKAKELSNEISKLQEIVNNGGYTKIPAFKTLREGDKSEIVKTLRKRLFESNDLTKACENIIMADKIITNNIEAVNNETSLTQENVTENKEIIEPINCEEIFDEDLKNAVISFQRSHGLEADGIVGANTQKYLNITAENKISTIRLNLERMRWLPRSLGERYLMVNIPDYKLKMIENGETKLDMAVVVGERKHPTPVFSNEMTFIVLNPYWRIPPRIVEREILPKLLADPNYLNGKGINIHESWDHTSEPLASNSIDWNVYNPENSENKEIPVQLPPFRLIQEPSEKNPLGRIKFMFPNKYSVYMHDTPAKSLFSRTRRAFSHGCIRLAQPKELLKAIASEDKNIDFEKANEILKEIDKTTIGLNRKIPVHIVYLTSWIDENGKLQFRDDIYNYDKTQTELFF